MNELVKIRETIRRFVSDYEKPLLWIFRGLLFLWIFHLIRTYFGYSASLDDGRITVALAVLCAFLPWSAGGLVIQIFLLLELLSLSPMVAAVALAVLVISYLLCAFYGSRHVHNLGLMPPLYPIQFSFGVPVISALFGEINEVTSVLCGGVFAFLLAVIRRNSSLFLEQEEVALPDFLLTNVLRNGLLVYYLCALGAAFLITWILRTRKMPFSWLIATAAGCAVQAVIMMAGYNANGNESRIPGLMGCSVLVFAVGAVISFFLRGLDYSRVEELNFEDDEYVYYVTAVPKIRFVGEEKRVSRITEAARPRQDGVRREGAAQAAAAKDNSVGSRADGVRRERTVSSGRSTNVSSRTDGVRREGAAQAAAAKDNSVGSRADGVRRERTVSPSRASGTRANTDRRASSGTGTRPASSRSASAGAARQTQNRANTTRTAAGQSDGDELLQSLERTLAQNNEAFRSSRRKTAASAKRASEKTAQSKQKLRPLDEDGEG